MDLKQNPDIIDVANHAGVSPATVSRAFNHPELLREDTRNRILQAVDAVGYIRNRAASQMHGKTSGTIGLLVPTIDNSIFSNLIQAFSETLNDLGYTMLISTHGYDLEFEYSQLRNLLEHRVDAIALVGLDHTDRTLRLLKTRRTPAIALWNYKDTSSVSCVGADNRQAGRLAAEHIVELGHKAVSVLFPPESGNDRARDRMLGVKEVLSQNNIEIDDTWQSTTKYDTFQARTVAYNILQQSERPTAIIAGNDIIARGAISAATDLGLTVPDEISIIGIGDFAGSAEFVPPLTTVNLDANTIGQQAADLLVNVLIEKGPDTIERISTEARLIVRASTKAPGNP